MKNKYLALFLAVVLSLSCMTVFSGQIFEEDELPDAIPGEEYRITLNIVHSDFDEDDGYFERMPDWLDVIWNDDKTVTLQGRVPDNFDGIEFLAGAPSAYDQHFSIKAGTAQYKASPLTPQVNVPDERIELPNNGDALEFDLTRTRRALVEKADVPFRIFAHDMSLYGEPVTHEQLAWSVSDESIAVIDSVTGWVELTGKEGSFRVTATYTEANGKEHTASYLVIVY